MAGRRKRPVPCPDCGGLARWDAYWSSFRCGNWDEDASVWNDGCGWGCAEEDAPAPADGRIRGPDDVAPRMTEAVAQARRDGRLSRLDRAVHEVAAGRAVELSYVEIMAGGEWLAEKAGARLGRPVSRFQAQRSRQRLEQFGYFRRMQVSEVSSHALRAAVQTRKSAGRRPAALIEVRRAPELPRCDHCGEEMADAIRASMRFCDDTCRKAYHRQHPPTPAEQEFWALVDGE